MKNFCKDFLKNADLDSGNVRAGILSYSTSVHAEFYLNSYSTTQEIMDAIDEIPYRYGSTNTYGGLRMMRTEFFSVANGDREDVMPSERASSASPIVFLPLMFDTPSVRIIVTSGTSSRSPLATEKNSVRIILKPPQECRLRFWKCKSRYLVL
jgi:aminopeptidase-like protein